MKIIFDFDNRSEEYHYTVSYEGYNGAQVKSLITSSYIGSSGHHSSNYGYLLDCVSKDLRCNHNKEKVEIEFSESISEETRAATKRVVALVLGDERLEDLLEMDF